MTISDTLIKVGEIRRKKNISTYDLQQAGITALQYTKIENGDRTITLRTLEKYVKAIGLKLEINNKLPLTIKITEK